MIASISSLLRAGKSEPLVSIDIGTSSIKVMQLDLSGEKPKLKSLGIAPTPFGVFANNAIAKPQEVAEAIRALLDSNQISTTKCVCAVPGPSAFSKKITVASTDMKELQQNISFEAANYIPHNIGAVRLDFQAIRQTGKSTTEVMLVAVKNEIVNSFLAALDSAGLEPQILDVDYFALENMFELNYPDEKNKTIALLDIGARFTSVLIMQNGATLFYGDVAVGGRLYTDALCEALQIKPKDAELIKQGKVDPSYDEHVIQEALERVTDHISGELQRQLAFFWNAAATDKSIEKIYACGGCVHVAGLLDELSRKTNTSCERLDAFRSIDYASSSFDLEYLTEIAPQMGVSVGLSLRRLGDKQHAV